MRARVGTSELASRIPLLRILLLASLVLVAAGYWNLQVIHGGGYRQEAVRNSLRRENLPPLRAPILDRKQRVLAEMVPVYELWWSPERAVNADASLEWISSVLGELDREADHWQPTSGSRLVAEDLGLDQVAQVEAHWQNYEDFAVRVGRRRLYRQGPNSAHLVGYLGAPTQQDLEGNSGLTGDMRVGRAGLEQQHDRELRGRAGERQVVVDSHGRLREEQSRRSPQSGSPLVLTIDLDLQQLARDLLGERIGAVVAMDVRDGNVLAMVSTPSFDPNIFSQRLDPQAWSDLISAPHNPLQDRTVQSAYSPGSVYKIVSAAAGLGERLIDPNKTVYCAGSMVVYGRRTRCWYRPGHGRTNLRSALRDSCDVYFYDLAQRLDIDILAGYSRKFGLGQATGVGLPSERSGLVPSRAWKRAERNEPWYPGETVSVSIGQGPILATPIQMARLLAVVATEGQLVKPRLVQSRPKESESTDLDRGHLRLIAEGLAEVVADGTGKSAKSEIVAIAGKTATVQVVEQVTWTKNEDLPVELRDHSWFASYAPVEDPELVVVVFVEHGGAGSQSAAPLAKALHERYFSSRI